MFRHHTAQFGTCASEVHKTLCYFFAGVNIFLAIDILADLSTGDILEKLDEDDSDERFDRQLLGSSISLLPLGPALANIVLAVVLIVGVYTRRPAFIRIFKLFVIAQIVVLLFAVFFSHRFLLTHEESYIVNIIVLAIIIALFGTEAWIAGDYYKLLMEEIRLESSATILEA
ncbi:uncharacterized protein LOC131434983 isoform X1 [Malaya genurostris]|uniref:uncharacterized protein LOC131434983 isoform X1 n=1 Tax=Malaya genurostris TaxID=325434 RepID=UPI0026F4089A|nr:uncharacterized protein LOC131434983 isoform X1 [Malaya genurostris]